MKCVQCLNYILYKCYHLYYASVFSDIQAVTVAKWLFLRLLNLIYFYGSHPHVLASIVLWSNVYPTDYICI